MEFPAVPLRTKLSRPATGGPSIFTEYDGIDQLGNRRCIQSTRGIVPRFDQRSFRPSAVLMGADARGKVVRALPRPACAVARIVEQPEGFPVVRDAPSVIGDREVGIPDAPVSDDERLLVGVIDAPLRGACRR